MLQTGSSHSYATAVLIESAKWQPHSPDLNQLDYMLRMNSNTYCTKPMETRFSTWNCYTEEPKVCMHLLEPGHSKMSSKTSSNERGVLLNIDSELYFK
jgi:hypothetical protein